MDAPKFDVAPCLNTQWLTAYPSITVMLPMHNVVAVIFCIRLIQFKRFIRINQGIFVVLPHLPSDSATVHIGEHLIWGLARYRQHDSSSTRCQPGGTAIAASHPFARHHHDTSSTDLLIRGVDPEVRRQPTRLPAVAVSDRPLDERAAAWVLMDRSRPWQVLTVYAETAIPARASTTAGADSSRPWFVVPSPVAGNSDMGQQASTAAAHPLGTRLLRSFAHPAKARQFQPD